jgi:hypothetical protein
MELENLLLTEEFTPTKFPSSPRKSQALIDRNQFDRSSVLSRNASGGSPLTRTLSGGRPITTVKTPSPSPSMVNSSSSPSSPVTPTTSSDKLISSVDVDVDVPKKRFFIHNLYNCFSFFIFFY